MLTDRNVVSRGQDPPVPCNNMNDRREFKVVESECRRPLLQTEAGLLRGCRGFVHRARFKHRQTDLGVVIPAELDASSSTAATGG